MNSTFETQPQQDENGSLWFFGGSFFRSGLLWWLCFAGVCDGGFLRPELQAWVVRLLLV
jgi:hypothetical protein